MGGLKPIGSEKLQGMDKIRRIMEIARHNENIPSSINENKSNTYSIDLADGNTYSIVKERQGYIIKSTINEGVEDYIEPIRERRYYKSYSQALKRLNLMAKEVNTLHENNSGTSLFGGEKKKLNETKYVLKTPESTTTTTTTAAPVTTATTTLAPAPVPAPAPTGEVKEQVPVADETIPPPPVEGGVPPQPIEGGAPPMEEPPMEEPPMEEPPMEEPPMDDDEGGKKDEVTFKLLQKLTGKLTQKIRKYNEDEEMSSDDTKYIINSVLSALELDVLDEEDVEEIIDRLEGAEEESFDDDMEAEMVDDEMEGDVPPPPVEDEMEGDVPPPPVEGGEMAEEFEFDFEDFDEYEPRRYDRSPMARAKKEAESDMRPYYNRVAAPGYEERDSSEWRSHTLPYDTEFFSFEDDFEEKLRPWGSKKNRHSKHLGHLEHGTWGESKVDKTISKYFLQSENERINKNKKHVKNLSENIAQERLGLKFIEKHPNSKVIGKLNNGYLVFESKKIKYRITPNAEII